LCGDGLRVRIPDGAPFRVLIGPLAGTLVRSPIEHPDPGPPNNSGSVLGTRLH
jgi:hypothetical protein